MHWDLASSFLDTPAIAYVKIRNPTSHTINFQFGYFGAASYKNYTINPETVKTFSLNTTFGTRLSPAIHYNSSFNSGYQDQSYALLVNYLYRASANSGIGIYQFKVSGSSINFYTT